MSYPSTTPPQPYFARLRTDIRKWWRNLYRQTFRRGDFEALYIAFGLLLFPILALNAAEWTDGLLILIPITVIALLVSHLLARSGFSEGYALLLTMLYGFATIITIHMLALPGNLSPADRIEELARRLRVWTVDVSAGTPATENLVFAIFLSVLFWLLAHNAIWHVIRLDRVWRAIIPAGLVLVINNAFYEGENNVNVFVLGFMFFALMLVVHNHTRTREYEWRRQRMHFSSRIHRGFIRAGGLITIIILLLTQLIPLGESESSRERLEEFLQSNPMQAITELWQRAFADLEGSSLSTTDYYGGDRLDLTGAVQLSDEPVMSVQISGVSPNSTRFYWRSTVFETYDGRGWEHQRSVRAFKESEGMTFNAGNYLARQNVVQEVTMQVRSTRLIHALAQIQQIDDLIVEAELNCVGGGTNCINENRESDVSLIRSRDPIRSNDNYTAVSSISTADAAQLRAAGTDYPQWVKDNYLQGASLLSPQAAAIAQSILTENGANNPYDAAKYIEQWLRTIEYDESIPAPPFNRDPIDYFLFDIQRGYCTYYASTMVMMLRSQGIPARMATGFAQGEYQGSGTYLVKENDAHTWVEVYFPSYGWINFEPTADESPLDRAGDPSFNPDLNLSTPEPTITPTPQLSATPEPQQNPAQPSPTLTPTPSPSPTLAQDQVVPAITATAENLPTNTMVPSPTPSLAPAPMLTPVADDDNTDIFEMILLVLLIAIISITILIILTLFTIWWIEHRGLGGLNPVQKAYARLGIYGRWLGLKLTNRQTPIERQHVLVEAVPDGQQPIETITDLYARDRFARPAKSQAETDTDARSAWSNARSAFIRRKFGRQRRQK